ncbi:MAG: hypothetical protein KatS3mg111_3883 [Pirellulaceae bacterium]|nr:MAG: hypothetical protein KatS3mg111_3883 [Pirellulaceae bacterium]
MGIATCPFWPRAKLTGAAIWSAPIHDEDEESLKQSPLGHVGFSEFGLQPPTSIRTSIVGQFVAGKPRLTSDYRAIVPAVNHC